MINEDKVKAVWILHQENVSVSKISKQLSLDRKTVQKIIKNQGVVIRNSRSDQLNYDDDLIIRTFEKCGGWGERTREELENLGVNIAYSTLMKRVKFLGLKEKQEKFSTPVPDIPGEENQHDLSPYKIKVGDKLMLVQASMLHYRYSKINYLKFYPSFNRFNMKCFFYEALNYLEYTPSQCVIDNTSLVILRGSGKNAVFNQEMVDFGKSFNFKWLAHEIKHSDRKAGVERSFWTLETNFFPGRDFSSLEDLNRQAMQWCERRAKKKNKNNIIPIDYFEVEKDYMKRVVPGINMPYKQHSRVIDQEGYVLFDTNLYWVGVQRRLKVVVLEYSSVIKFFHQRKLLREYALPAFGVRENKYNPSGVTLPYRPKKITIPSHDEEKELVNYSDLVRDYLSFALKTQGPQNRYQMIRQIYYLYKNLSPSIFDKTIDRAFKYKIKNKAVLEKIAVYILGQEGFDSQNLEIDFSLNKSAEYFEGLYGGDVSFDSWNLESGGNL